MDNKVRIHFTPENRGLKVTVKKDGKDQTAYATFAGMTPGSKPGGGNESTYIQFEDGTVIGDARVVVPADTPDEKGEDNITLTYNTKNVARFEEEDKRANSVVTPPVTIVVAKEPELDVEAVEARAEKDKAVDDPKVAGKNLNLADPVVDFE